VATRSIIQIACRNFCASQRVKEWQLLPLVRRAGRSLTSPALALRVAQRSFTATDVRLAAVGNRSRDETDCSVGIVTGSTRDGLAGTPVTTKKPRKYGNCLVANLSIWGRNQDIHEICHYVGNAKVLCAASLTGKAMQCNFAHRCHGVTESQAKYIPRGIAGVVVQKKQAGSPDCQVWVAKCGDFDGSDGHVTSETRAPRPRQLVPSTDKIVRDFKVGPRHGG